MKVNIVFQGTEPHLEFVEVEHFDTGESVRIGEWSTDEERGCQVLTVDVLTEAEAAHYRNLNAVTLLNEALGSLDKSQEQLETVSDNIEKTMINIEKLMKGTK